MIGDQFIFTFFIETYFDFDAKQLNSNQNKLIWSIRFRYEMGIYILHLIPPSGKPSANVYKVQIC